MLMIEIMKDSHRPTNKQTNKQKHLYSAISTCNASNEKARGDLE